MAALQSSHTVEVQCEYLPVDFRIPNLVAYRGKTVWNGEIRARLDGLCFLPKLEEAIASGDVRDIPEAKTERGALICLATPDTLAKVREDGFDELFDHVIGHNFFGAYQSGDVAVVEVDYDSYQLYDANGNMLPTMVFFDYINGWFNNYHYDLNKALKILESRSDVELYRDSRTGRKIQEIPYFNRDEHRTHSISFKWMPTPDDMKRVQVYLEAQERYIDIQEACFHLDIFGLRAAGASLSETFYRMVPGFMEEE